MPFKRTLAFGLALLSASPAVPQGLNLDLSIPSVAVLQNHVTGAPPACNAGQLDFSVATGCNTTLYMVLWR